MYPQGATLLWRYSKTFGFNFVQAKEIIHSLKGQSGKRFLSSSHVLVIDRDALIIKAHVQNWEEVAIEKEQTESSLGPCCLKVEHLTTVMPLSDDKEAILDIEQLTFPLRWRKWKAGDFFYPLGMEHKKKLSDFFIDKKLSVADKEIVTVLESEGRIVWVVGYRIDDRFKLTTKTTQMIRFRVSSLV